MKKNTLTKLVIGIVIVVIVLIVTHFMMSGINVGEGLRNLHG